MSIAGTPGASSAAYRSGVPRDVPRLSDAPRALPRRLPLLCAALLALCAATCKGGREEAPRSAAPVDPAQALYAQGKYVEALPLLEQAAAVGRTGSLLYQIGYCKGVIEGRGGSSRKQLWSEARPLLEQEVAAPGQATLDRLYYLTIINAELGESESMRKYGRQAIDTIEKTADPNALAGEEWFRLARIHEFLEESSQAEAAYRRAISAFHKAPAVNPSYQALSLARVGDLDFDEHRYDAAATSYEEAVKLVPSLDQVRPYRRGLAHFGAGRIDEAIAAFASDPDPVTNTESQYAADLGRKAKAVGGMLVADADGSPIDRMALADLEERIKQAGSDYRAAREKHSFKSGDPLSAELADRQKRFVSLLRERLLQTGEVQEFCLKEGIADLVRR